MNFALLERQHRAVAELHRLATRPPALNVESLWTGLATLRKLFLTRLQSDLKLHFGAEPVLPPPTLLSWQREFRHAAGEIEAYSLAIVVAEVERNLYAPAGDDGFRQWLLRLRWGENTPADVALRLDSYRSLTVTNQRPVFTSYLERVCAEAARAPLALYRLYPLAVSLATALAFGDRRRARELRCAQIGNLPAIEDCLICHGRPLDNGEVCRECGNPLWKLHWLCATE